MKEKLGEGNRLNTQGVNNVKFNNCGLAYRSLLSISRYACRWEVYTHAPFLHPTGFPTPEVRWERTVKGGRVEIRDNDFFVNVKQTTDNQNMMAGEQWYTLKVSRFFLKFRIFSLDLTLYGQRLGKWETNQLTRFHERQAEWPDIQPDLPTQCLT